MKITPIEITVGEIIDAFQDGGQAGGVSAYGGKLDVRPAYQREFVYSEKQRKAVIHTVLMGFPLNVMYWAKIDNEDRYEILDGQQRTMSLAQFAGVPIGFPIDDPMDGNKKAFHSLSPDRQKQFLDYRLTVYVCEGNHDEKMSWFKTINIAGAVLTDQELRNAVYVGRWTAQAKRRFSGHSPNAAAKSKGLVKVKPLRQELLELAIKWIAGARDEQINQYMSVHQHDTNDNEIWLHFCKVVDWANAIFPEERELREKVDWGTLYRDHGAAVTQPDPDILEKEIKKLLMDDEVTNKAGIYPYVLDRSESHLSLRFFSDQVKLATYTKQAGICPLCQNTFALKEMDGDHIVPWSKGGLTVAPNCQMLCATCNANKSNKGNGPSQKRGGTKV